MSKQKSKAWQYRTRNGASGTLVGVDVDTEREAKEILARVHRIKMTEIYVKDMAKARYRL